MDLFGHRFAIPTGLQHGTVTVLSGPPPAGPPGRGHHVPGRGRVPGRATPVVGRVRQDPDRGPGPAGLHHERHRLRSADRSADRSVRRPGRSAPPAGAGGGRSGAAIPRGRPAPDAGGPSGHPAWVRHRSRPPCRPSPRRWPRSAWSRPSASGTSCYKILAAAQPARGFELLKDCGLLAEIMPELLEGVGCAQNRFHRFDVWGHTLATLAARLGRRGPAAGGAAARRGQAARPGPQGGRRGRIQLLEARVHRGRDGGSPSPRD